MMIAKFAKSSTKLLALSGVALLFAPRVNLIVFAGQTAGLRVDDSILLIISGILLWGVLASHRLKASDTEKLAFWFIGTSIASNILNTLFYSRSNFAYSLRICEYFVFFYLGSLFARNYRLQRLAQYLLWINGIVMVLQVAGFVGAFTSDRGVVAESAGRAMGLTGGPWEVGTLINFCTAILAFDKKIHWRHACLLFVVSYFLILLTGARMPLLANTVLVWLYIARHSQHRAAATVKFFVGILVLCICILLVPNPLTKRSVNLFSAANIEYFKEAYGSIDPGSEPLEFSDITVPDDSDMSWMMRTVKWVYAIKVWRESPACWFFGVGPGTWGPALDGGWLRLLTENGVIGLVLFILMVRSRDCRQSIMGPITYCLFINMLMIDLNISYKTMTFVFFVQGYCISRKSASGESAVTE